MPHKNTDKKKPCKKVDKVIKGVKVIYLKEIKEGDIIAVHWRDITLHDKIRKEEIPNDKFMKYITTIPPTITYGRYIGNENKCIVVSQEYCTDDGSDATMLEVIPIGCIFKIEIFKVRRVVMY